MSIIKLAEELIILLQSFLLQKDYHSLMNTSKQYFHDVKKKTIYFMLNKEYSLRYFEDLNFRSLLLNQVENGWKQIGLILWKPWDGNKELPLHHVRFVFQDCPPLTDLDHIESIDGSCSLQTIPFLPKLKKLVIRQGIELKNVQHLSHLSDISFSFCLLLTDIRALKDVPNLSFEYCGIQNISMLGNQRKLRIASSLIMNVHSLSNVRYLSLHDCGNIVDVSSLKGIYHLKITHCKKIEDISGLGGHYLIMIETLSPNLKGFHSLAGVPHINLVDCSLFMDSSFLRHCKSVVLHSCRDFHYEDLKYVYSSCISCRSFCENECNVCTFFYD